MILRATENPSSVVTYVFDEKTSRLLSVDGTPVHVRDDSNFLDVISEYHSWKDIQLQLTNPTKGTHFNIDPIS
jgi:hypothetical protein